MIRNEKNSKILVVEDNEALRMDLVKCLTTNHEVICAENGQAALKLLEKVQPDLILLNIVLPFPLDGFSILRYLKNEPRFAYIPVIMLSSLNSEHAVLESFKMGANDCIVKPLRYDELLLKCNNLISLQSHIQNQFNIKETLEMNLFQIRNLDSEFKDKFSEAVEAIVDGTSDSIPLLAEKMLMSVSTLERWTKRIFDTTPKQYILNRKLSKAAIFLRQEKVTVNHIAYNLGFNSVSYFCVCFKKKYGRTPKSFVRGTRMIAPLHQEAFMMN